MKTKGKLLYFTQLDKRARPAHSFETLSLSIKLLFPITAATQTVYWFLHGKKYSSPPKHFNCRRQAIDLKHISTEG